MSKEKKPERIPLLTFPIRSLLFLILLEDVCYDHLTLILHHHS